MGIFGGETKSGYNQGAVEALRDTINSTAQGVSEVVVSELTKIQKKYYEILTSNLLDKILIISALVISSIGLILNIVGVGLSIKYLNDNGNSTTLQGIYSRCSLLLLFENILLTICWICFVIYWIWNILNFLSKPISDKESDKEKINKEEKPNNGSKSLSVKNPVVMDEPVAPVVPLDTEKISSTDRKIVGDNIIK